MVREHCAFTFLVFKQNLGLQPTKFKSRLTSKLAVMLHFRSVGSLLWLFERFQCLHCKAIWSKAFSSGSGRKWTSSKCFRPHLHLYLA